MRRRIVVVIGLASSLARAVHAQEPDGPLPNGALLPALVFAAHGGTQRSSAALDSAASIVGGAQQPLGVKSSPLKAPADRWWAPLASAAFPGVGQAQLKQDRFVAYMAVEGFLWLRYLSDRREAFRQRDAYREVALRVSRAGFDGSKPPGDFEYYERMEHWIASGVYDADPTTPGLDPEVDTTTFNGAMWLLARRTYWSRPDTPPPLGSPAYIAALSFYADAAIRPDFQWTWRNSRLEQDIYRRHIKESNDAFRHALQDVGLVIANHVLSTVDAYVSLRLRMRAQLQPNGASSIGLSASVPLDALGGAAH
jgi:hypothetical protein